MKLLAWHWVPSLPLTPHTFRPKGKRFLQTTCFPVNPLTTDALIDDTLECLRQHVERGIARSDEKHIEQTLHAITALLQLYAGIDYSTPHAHRFHAHLAGGYLTSALESIVPHDMCDVLLEGQKLMTVLRTDHSLAAVR